MKKLTSTIILALVLTAGSYTTAFACGHQHAEKCFASTVDSGGKTYRTEKTDVPIKTDRTAGTYETTATDQTGAPGQADAIYHSIWKDAIQILWTGLLRTGLTW